MISTDILSLQLPKMMVYLTGNEEINCKVKVKMEGDINIQDIKLNCILRRNDEDVFIIQGNVNYISHSPHFFI